MIATVKKRRSPYVRTIPMMLKRIPVDVKAQYKAWCAKRGITMLDHIVFLMRQTINSDKPYMPLNPRARRKQ